MTAPTAPFVIGWEEWAALPALGLPAIKVKIDTGARTSALHAFRIEPFGGASGPMVRFGIHPVPGRHDIEIVCEAPIVDRREVTSSNGVKERRFVIVSDFEIGGRVWPIEITLTNREAMTYRMLLGRQAIREHVLVDPASSFHQPRRSYKLYRGRAGAEIVRRRSLSLALLTARPEASSNRQLASLAAKRGHRLEVIDVGALKLAAGLQILGDGRPLPRCDALLPRLSHNHGVLATAALRELELGGAVTLNSADAIEALANPLFAPQRLARAGIAVQDPVAGSQPTPRWGGVSPPDHRFLVVDGRVAGMWPVAAGEAARHTGIGGIAVRAAQCLGLGFCAVDLALQDGQPLVRRITTAPALTRFVPVDATALVQRLLAAVERRTTARASAEDGED